MVKRGYIGNNKNKFGYSEIFGEGDSESDA